MVAAAAAWHAAIEAHMPAATVLGDGGDGTTAVRDAAELTGATAGAKFEEGDP